jgi:hypothetical protein
MMEGVFVCGDGSHVRLPHGSGDGFGYASKIWEWDCGFGFLCSCSGGMGVVVLGTGWMMLEGVVGATGGGGRGG